MCDVLKAFHFRPFQESALAIVFPGTFTIQAAKLFDESRKLNFRAEKRSKKVFFQGELGIFNLKSGRKSNFITF